MEKKSKVGHYSWFWKQKFLFDPERSKMDFENDYSRTLEVYCFMKIPTSPILVSQFWRVLLVWLKGIFNNEQPGEKFKTFGIPFLSIFIVVIFCIFYIYYNLYRHTFFDKIFSYKNILILLKHIQFCMANSKPSTWLNSW